MAKSTGEFVEALESLVQEMVRGQMEESNYIDDKVGSAVESALENFEVEADNVRGLEDAIESGVESALEDFVIEADDVRGLGDFIENYLNEEHLTGNGFHNRVAEVVKQTSGALIGKAEVQGAVITALQSPEVQEVLQAQVRMALGSVLQQLLQPPVAKPVG